MFTLNIISLVIYVILLIHIVSKILYANDFVKVNKQYSESLNYIYINEKIVWLNNFFNIR